MTTVTQDTPRTHTDQLTRPGERHPVYEYLANLSPGSQNGARSKLRKAVATWSDQPVQAVTDADLFSFPWHQVDHTATVTLKQRLLREELSTRYINTILAHLSGVLEEAAHLDDGVYRSFDAGDHARAMRKVRLRGESEPKGRALSQGEVNALIGACARDEGPAGLRDGAIISVFVACGLRVAEMASLRLSDYSPKLDQVRVRKGKGRKSRTVPLVNGAGRTLRDWIALRGADHGPLWNPIDRWHTTDTRQGVSTVAIAKMLERRQAEASIAAFTPHDLRRTCGTLLYEAGVDLLTIQKYLGHRSIETTQRYIMVATGEQAKREAAERVHIPALRDLRRAAG